MSIKTRYVAEVTTREVPDAALAPAVPSVASPLVHSAFSTTKNLDATSTPAVSKCAYLTKALVAGAGTIDLTALPHNGGTVDLTGLRVEVLKFKNKTGNAVMTISEGASNGYEALGNAWSIKLLAGQEATFFLNDAAPVVSGTLKTIDVAGTGTEQLEVSVVGG